MYQQLDDNVQLILTGMLLFGSILVLVDVEWRLEMIVLATGIAVAMGCALLYVGFIDPYWENNLFARGAINAAGLLFLFIAYIIYHL
jgi:hypothetical protein